jgi:hypothetical protein
MFRTKTACYCAVFCSPVQNHNTSTPMSIIIAYRSQLSPLSLARCRGSTPPIVIPRNHLSIQSSVITLSRFPYSIVNDQHHRPPCPPACVLPRRRSSILHSPVIRHPSKAQSQSHRRIHLTPVVSQLSLDNYYESRIHDHLNVLKSRLRAPCLVSLYCAYIVSNFWVLAVSHMLLEDRSCMHSHERYLSLNCLLRKTSHDTSLWPGNDQHQRGLQRIIDNAPCRAPSAGIRPDLAIWKRRDPYLRLDQPDSQIAGQAPGPRDRLPTIPIQCRSSSPSLTRADCRHWRRFDRVPEPAGVVEAEVWVPRQTCA